MDRAAQVIGRASHPPSMLRVACLRPHACAASTGASMAAPILQASAQTSAQALPAGVPAYRSALALLASLFFMWGFITVINNTLLPHLRSVFELDYTRTTLIESVWFIAYFVASIPSAWLIERVGYQRAIVIGLLVMAFGALMMVPAARIPSYGLVLTALVVIARGLTLPQAAAN